MTDYIFVVKYLGFSKKTVVHIAGWSGNAMYNKWQLGWRNIEEILKERFF